MACSRQTYPWAQPQDTATFVSNSQQLETSCYPVPWRTVAVTTNSTPREASTTETLFAHSLEARNKN